MCQFSAINSVNFFSKFLWNYNSDHCAHAFSAVQNAPVMACCWLTLKDDKCIHGWRLNLKPTFQLSFWPLGLGQTKIEHKMVRYMLMKNSVKRNLWMCDRVHFLLCCSNSLLFLISFLICRHGRELLSTLHYISCSNWPTFCSIVKSKFLWVFQI